MDQLSIAQALGNEQGKKSRPDKSGRLFRI